MNRAFLYGDGFFETIRVVDGQIPLNLFHLQRIQSAMEIMRFQPEFEITEEFLTDTLKPETLGNARVRMNFFREGEGKYLPENNSVAFNFDHENTTRKFFLPTALDLKSEIKQAPEAYGSLGLFEDPKPTHSLYTIKTVSSAYYVLAALFKNDASLDYLCLQNASGEVIEELNSNLLILNDDQLFIPPLSSGMLLGVTLRYLWAAYHFQLVERTFSYEELLQADQIYCCNAISGITRIK